MVEFEVTGTTVTVHITGTHRLLALRENVVFDMSQVTRITMAPVDLRPPWVRAPGTFLPGVIAAGIFRGKGRKEFWDTRFEGSALQIDLAGGSLTRLVVDTDDPTSTYLRLSKAAAA